MDTTARMRFGHNLHLLGDRRNLHLAVLSPPCYCRRNCVSSIRRRGRACASAFSCMPRRHIRLEDCAITERCARLLAHEGRQRGAPEPGSARALRPPAPPSAPLAAAVTSLPAADGRGVRERARLLAIVGACQSGSGGRLRGCREHRLHTGYGPPSSARIREANGKQLREAYVGHVVLLHVKHLRFAREIIRLALPAACTRRRNATRSAGQDQAPASP